MSCSQNFGNALTKMFRQTGGDNLFAGLSVVSLEGQNDIIDNIVNAILEDTPDVNAASSYDFESFKRILKARGELPKFRGLTKEVIDKIALKLKDKITNTPILTNPEIDEEGNTLFNFDNISKLTYGIESMENFLTSELQQGIFKCSFLMPIPLSSNDIKNLSFSFQVLIINTKEPSFLYFSAFSIKLYTTFVKCT